MIREQHRLNSRSVFIQSSLRRFFSQTRLQTSLSFPSLSSSLAMNSCLLLSPSVISQPVSFLFFLFLSDMNTVTTSQKQNATHSLLPVLFIPSFFLSSIRDIYLVSPSDVLDKSLFLFIRFFVHSLASTY